MLWIAGSRELWKVIFHLRNRKYRHYLTHQEPRMACFKATKMNFDKWFFELLMRDISLEVIAHTDL